MTSQLPAAADVASEGRPAVARATLALSLGQLVSWGVLFYAIPVAAPAIAEDTGWSVAWLTALFSIALLVSGSTAPAVARALDRRGGRLVLTAGSAIGALAVAVIAVAPNLAVLAAGFVLLGVAMAAVLYEPAMAVLVALDPARRARTLTVLSVFGGLASTVYAPLTHVLLDAHGWRVTLAVLGVTGGAFTALLHRCLPPGRHGGHGDGHRAEPFAAADAPDGYRHLRVAQVLEQTAHIATTATFVALLLARGVPAGSAALLLATMGAGRTLGRLLLAGTGVAERHGTTALVLCNIAQLVTLAAPLLATSPALLAPVCVAAGASSGVTTVLRPLVLVELVGVPRFAAANARLSRAASIGRAGGPAAIGALAAVVGWSTAWLLTLLLFGAAADRYRRAR